MLCTAFEFVEVAVETFMSDHYSTYTGHMCTFCSHRRGVLLRKAPLLTQKEPSLQTPHTSGICITAVLSNGYSRAYIICMSSGSNAAEPPNTRIIMLLIHCKY